MAYPPPHFRCSPLTVWHWEWLFAQTGVTGAILSLLCTGGWPQAAQALEFSPDRGQPSFSREGRLEPSLGLQEEPFPCLPPLSLGT